MGEKGNDPAALAASVIATAEPSVIEKVTTTTTQTVVGAGQDVLAKIRDKAVDQGSDAVFEGARRRIRGEDPVPGSDPDEPGASDSVTDGEADGAAPRG